MSWSPRSRVLFPAAILLLCSPFPSEGQTTREAIESLEFRELQFEVPEVRTETLASGVEVLFLEDHALPLVTLYARFKGGFALFPRERYAAATALSGIVRAGGTRDIPPDSVDHLLDFFALQTVFGGGGQSSFSSLNTLKKHLTPAVQLWEDILKNPGFDSTEVEVWRGRQGESIRRRKDSPGGLAFSEFNRIMFGDHPIGWEMEEADLAPDRLSSETLAEVHSQVFCPENLLLGVVGDVSWGELEPLLEDMTDDWASCPGPLPEPLVPAMRQEPGVFLIPKALTQSTVVMAHPGGIKLGAGEDYFASRIGNSILGASGFSSRLLSRVRTEKGLAYSASSLWTTPSSYEGIIGAVTQTKSQSTVAAVQLILSTMEELRNTPPALEEVERAVNQIVNGFVFNFQSPAQILSRKMFYIAQGLPEDWLEQYVQGIQEVSPEQVRQVFETFLHPEEMTILILGDPDTFDLPLETLGPVRIWPVSGLSWTPVPVPTESPHGGLRFRP